MTATFDVRDWLRLAPPPHLARTPSAPAAGGWWAEYREYLASPEWAARAEAVKRAAGYRCATCGARREDGAVLHAHHVTYERVRHEAPGDVVCLCEACHAALTASIRARRKAGRKC